MSEGALQMLGMFGRSIIRHRSCGEKCTMPASPNWMLLIALAIAAMHATPGMAQDQWGDIPENELEGMVLFDFIRGTPEEARTLEVLKFLGLSTKQGLRAVFFTESSRTNSLPDSKKGVSLIMQGCSIDLAAHSRAVIHYEGYSRKDVPQRSKVEFSEQARDEAVALVRSLGTMMGFDLSSVEERVELDGKTIWEIDFYQVFDGYLCPTSVFSAEVNANSSTVCSVTSRPFITTGQTKISITKTQAIEKACAAAKENHRAYKGKDVVTGTITVEKPQMFPVGADRDENDRDKGQIGRLAWPVYMDGGSLIIYIDCENGDVLRSIK
jgi:hypothetical protein